MRCLPTAVNRGAGGDEMGRRHAAGAEHGVKKVLRVLLDGKVTAPRAGVGTCSCFGEHR